MSSDASGGLSPPFTVGAKGQERHRCTVHRRSLLASTPDEWATPLLKWFSANARDLPWRRMRDPYAIWISEIMLQQTQVQTVIPYWERWMRALPNVEALSVASDER